MWISKLDPRCRNIGDADLINFAGAIARGALPKLEILSLYKNHIGDAGLIAFAEALKSPRGGAGVARPIRPVGKGMRG